MRQSSEDITVEVLNNSPPLLTPERAGINTVLCDLVNQSKSIGASFASDAGPLQGMGLECVLFGPGSIDVAHRPNEFLPIDEFQRARPILERLVDHFCYCEP